MNTLLNAPLIVTVSLIWKLTGSHAETLITELPEDARLYLLKKPVTRPPEMSRLVDRNLKFSQF